MNILVIGRGSIGKQHLKSLRSLEKTHELTVREFQPTSHGPAYVNELQHALESQHIEAVLICNPTSLHVETTLTCLRAGTHVFLEKPLGMSFDAKNFKEIERLVQEKKRTFMVGYDMRFNPWIVKVKKHIEQNTIGKIWGARVMAGQYLPDWRPGTDYRQTYSAKKELGGGVLLDLSHELDYLLWLMPQKVAEVTARTVTTLQLEIDTEDMASVIVGFEGGVSAQVHLDYLTVPYRRSLEVYGDTGTILWDDNAHTLRIYTKKEGRWRTERVAKKDATTPVI